MKSNDTINMSIKKWGQNSSNNPDEFLRSHDIQFTIGDDTFQEVVCHTEKLGGNDEVSNFILSYFYYYLKFFC